MKKDTKITGIDEIDHIINGSIDQLRNLKNPNQVGQVLNKVTNEVLSNITPLIMIINQSFFKTRGKNFNNILKIILI